MYTNSYKIVFLFRFCSISYLSIGIILIVKTEATNTDIKYELFHSRSATNLTLSHPLPENVYYMSKKSINSNNVMPSSVTSGHLMANTETGNTSDNLIDFIIKNTLKLSHQCLYNIIKVLWILNAQKESWIIQQIMLKAKIVSS